MLGKNLRFAVVIALAGCGLEPSSGEETDSVSSDQELKHATLTVSPNPLVVGQTDYTVAGTRFRRNQFIRVCFPGFTWDTCVSLTADGNGNFSFAAPQSAPWTTVSSVPHPGYALVALGYTNGWETVAAAYIGVVEK